MSQQERPQISLQEYISRSRNQIVLAYDGAKEIALKGFDDLTSKYVEALQTIEKLKKQPEKEKTKKEK